MKVQPSTEEVCKDTIIRSLEYLDYEKLKFLKKIAVGLVNLPINDIRELLLK